MSDAHDTDLREPDHVASRPISRIALASAVVFVAALGIAAWLAPRAPERTPPPPPRDDGRGLALAEQQRTALERDIAEAMDRLLAHPPPLDAGVEP